MANMFVLGVLSPIGFKISLLITNEGKWITLFPRLMNQEYPDIRCESTVNKV